MSKFRFVAVHPDRPALWKLGSAAALHDLLIDNQTDAAGRVFYGHAISYAWILARWPGNPDERPVIRTLKRHMAKLKAAGLVRVKKAGMLDGMRVVLLGSAKWANAAPPPPVQLPLLLPQPVSISSGKPSGMSVGNQSKSSAPAGTDVSLPRGQMCPRKEVRSKAEEKIRGNPARYARSSPVEEAEARDARRKLLREQAEMLKSKFKSAV